MSDAPRRGKFQKGQSGNPGGIPKAAIELRRALEQDGPRIHAALMALVEAGNPQAVIYAHQRVFGKPPSSPEDREHQSGLVDRVAAALAQEPDDSLLELWRRLQGNDCTPVQ